MKVPLFFLLRRIVLTTVGRIASVGTATPFLMRGRRIYANWDRPSKRSIPSRGQVVSAVLALRLISASRSLPIICSGVCRFRGILTSSPSAQD